MGFELNAKSQKRIMFCVVLSLMSFGKLPLAQGEVVVYDTNTQPSQKFIHNNQTTQQVIQQNDSEKRSNRRETYQKYEEDTYRQERPKRRSRRTVRRERRNPRNQRSERRDYVYVSRSGVKHHSSEYKQEEENFLESVMVSIEPRFGISNFADDVSGYDLSSKYAFGLGLNLGTSENFSLDLGYSRAKHELELLQGNASYGSVQDYYGYYGNGFRKITLNQNVFDLGIKGYLLNSSSTLRPFLGGGIAYGSTTVDSEQDRYSYGYFGEDYGVDQFLGHLSAGLDFELGAGFRSGLLFKYYHVLSSSEDQSIDNRLFAPRGGRYQARGSGNEKRYVGASLKDSGFYTLMLGVNFTF